MEFLAGILNHRPWTPDRAFADLICCTMVSFVLAAFKVKSDKWGAKLLLMLAVTSAVCGAYVYFFYIR
jgi:hypothetical protein